MSKCCTCARSTFQCRCSKNFLFQTGFGWQQVFPMEFLGAMVVQLFLFYWHANEIILEVNDNVVYKQKLLHNIVLY